MPVIDTAYN